MAQHQCNLTSDREETLIAYLYDDIEPGERAAFREHLITCDRCRTDLQALGHVRAQLARWSPPEPNFARPAAATVLSGPGRRSRWAFLGDIPAWAQVAAALLFLGISAGVANLDVRYDQNGLTLRTGWSKTANPPPAAAVPVAGRTETAAPWRAELAALERQLRSEMRSLQPVAVRPAPSEAEVVRRVRSMLDESERRQQNELALRVGEMYAELNAKRQAEMTRLGQSLRDTRSQLGAVGAEVLRTRSSLNYFINANQRQ